MEIIKEILFYIYVSFVMIVFYCFIWKKLIVHYFLGEKNSFFLFLKEHYKTIIVISLILAPIAMLTKGCEIGCQYWNPDDC